MKYDGTRSHIAVAKLALRRNSWGKNRLVSNISTFTLCHCFKHSISFVYKWRKGSQVNMSKQEKSEDSDNLQGFVLDEYKKQSDARKGTKADDQLDEATAAQFYSRALAECKRMNGEIEKSYSKMSQLHDEFGTEMFDSWRNEHCAEALSKEQQQAVEKAHRGVPS